MKARGRPRHPDVLTPTEWKIVDAIRHGMSNRLIAQRRGISLDAVKFHVANALDKLGLPDRAALRRWRGLPADSTLRKEGVGVSLQLGRIGQISRPVRDIGRSVDWYRDVLGLPHLYTFGDLAFFDCAGTRLFLSALKEEAAAGASVLYFQVDDIQATFDELSARGIEFAAAPHMIFKHESGVEEWMAFFPDPDGHMLAIMSQAGP